jgi:hypothetical protein
MATTSETLWNMMLQFPEESIEYYVLRKASRELKRYENRKYSNGVSRGRLDKLERRYVDYRNKGVPRELWDNDLLAYEAYEVHGLACPSSPNASVLQETGGQPPNPEAQEEDLTS